jgi:hypothetical protein
MDDIVLTRTLVGQGFDDRDLVRMRRDGTLVPVRRGAYVRERPAERTRAEEHRELIFATAPQLHDGAGRESYLGCRVAPAAHLAHGA